MSKAKIWASWLAIFLSGLVIGGAVTAFGFKRAIARHIEGGPTAARTVLVRVLRHELELTREQVPDVERAVAKAHDDLLALRRRSQPEVEAVLERAVAEMKPSLTPEQQARLDELYARARNRRAVQAMAGP